MKNDISVMEARLAQELKDIKGTVEHSNSSVRTLQSTFAAEKLRKLSRDKANAAAESPATKSGATQPGGNHSCSSQGMVSESGHVITNAVPGTLSSSPSASRPRPRDVQGSSSGLGYKGGSLSIPENAAALKANASWPNELTQEQVNSCVLPLPPLAAAAAAAAAAVHNKCLIRTHNHFPPGNCRRARVSIGRPQDRRCRHRRLAVQCTRHHLHSVYYCNI